MAERLCVRRKGCQLPWLGVLELYAVGPLLVVLRPVGAGLAAGPGMCPVLCGSAHDDKEQIGAVGWHCQLGGAFFVGLYGAVGAGAVGLHTDEGIAPAGTLRIDVVVPLGIGEACEVCLHGGACRGARHLDDGIAVVLDAMIDIGLIDGLGCVDGL